MSPYIKFTVAILMLSAVAGDAPPAFAQQVLDRLEKAIRRQVEEQAPPEQPRAADAAAGERKAADNENGPGFLGALTDDRDDRGRGVRVVGLRPDAPAAKAGLKLNDLIVAVAGTRVRRLSEFGEALALFPPGETVLFDVERDGKRTALKVTLGQRPADGQPAANPDGPELLPKPPVLRQPAVGQPADVAALQKRVEQLEQRVEELEKVLGEVLNKK